MTRFGLALALVLGQLVALLPAASAQEPLLERLEVTFEPRMVTTQIVGGCEPNALCPIVRGVTYTVEVAFSVNIDADSMVILVDGGGLEIEAMGSDGETTSPLPAGGSDTLTLDITIPEAKGRRDRSFFLGRVRLVGEAGTFILPISVILPTTRITWGQVVDAETDERASIVARVGSGESFTRRVALNSNIDVESFSLRATSDLVTLGDVPDRLTAAQSREITIRYDAPIVNRTMRSNIRISAADGLLALQNTLRLRVIVLPVRITWSPTFVRKTLQLQDRRAVPVTVTATSNYDVSGVTFKTADLGLTPIVSPLGPVDLKAGEPQPVSFLICPGYAPTQYFLGITAMHGAKPLNRRLSIRSNVVDPDGDGLQPRTPECIE